MARQSPVSPQSSELVPQSVGILFLPLLRQQVEAKQGGEEAKAGLRPNHGVQTNQSLQGDEELGGGDQVEGGQAEGEG